MAGMFPPPRPLHTPSRPLSSPYASTHPLGLFPPTRPLPTPYSDTPNVAEQKGKGNLPFQFLICTLLMRCLFSALVCFLPQPMTGNPHPILPHPTPSHPIPLVHWRMQATPMHGLLVANTSEALDVCLAIFRALPETMLQVELARAAVRFGRAIMHTLLYCLLLTARCLLPTALRTAHDSLLTPLSRRFSDYLRTLRSPSGLALEVLGGPYS